MEDGSVPPKRGGKDTKNRRRRMVSGETKCGTAIALNGEVQDPGGKVSRTKRRKKNADAGTKKNWGGDKICGARKQD